MITVRNGITWYLSLEQITKKYNMKTEKKKKTLQPLQILYSSCSTKVHALKLTYYYLPKKIV